GYIETPKLLEELRKAVAPAAGTDAPQWMVRDYQDAAKCIANRDTSRAIVLLKTIVESDKEIPLRLNAQQMLRQLERQAESRLQIARKAADDGQALDAFDALHDLVRQYAGTPAANEASGMLTSLAAKPEIRERQRARRARELLAQARDELRAEQFLACLEKCELLAASYSD